MRRGVRHPQNSSCCLVGVPDTPKLILLPCGGHQTPPALILMPRRVPDTPELLLLSLCTGTQAQPPAVTLVRKKKTHSKFSLRPPKLKRWGFTCVCLCVCKRESCFHPQSTPGNQQEGVLKCFICVIKHLAAPKDEGGFPGFTAVWDNSPSQHTPH